MPRAIIKFNGGRGALLCNYCNIIIREDFNPKEIADIQHYCDRCTDRYEAGYTNGYEDGFKAGQLQEQDINKMD